MPFTGDVGNAAQLGTTLKKLKVSPTAVTNNTQHTLTVLVQEAGAEAGKWLGEVKSWHALPYAPCEIKHDRMVVLAGQWGHAFVRHCTEVVLHVWCACAPDTQQATLTHLSAALFLFAPPSMYGQRWLSSARPRTPPRRQSHRPRRVHPAWPCSAARVSGVAGEYQYPLCRLYLVHLSLM